MDLLPLATFSFPAIMTVMYYIFYKITVTALFNKEHFQQKKHALFNIPHTPKASWPTNAPSQNRVEVLAFLGAFRYVVVNLK